MRKLVLWAVAVVVLAACSSGGAPRSPSADQAANDAANALCQKFGSCSPFLLHAQYGDLVGCEAAAKASLAKTIAASGSGETADDAEACAAAIATASCADVIGHNLPSACQSAAGQLASGAACGESSQCQTSFCHKAPGSTCGACAAVPAAGASCFVDDDCSVGEVCSKAGTCALAGGSGASCDPIQRPCNPTLTCKDGTCAAPDEAGAPCSKMTTRFDSVDTCDAVAGLYCAAQGTAVGTCVKLSLLNPGTPCLFVNNMFGIAFRAADCAFPLKCETGRCTAVDPASCQ